MAGMKKPFAPQISSALLAGGLACFVYLVFFGGHYVMGDHAYRMAWAKSVAMSLTVGLPATSDSARNEPSGATTMPR